MLMTKSVCVIALVSATFVCNATTYIDQQTKEVSELAKKYSLADEVGKRAEIKKIANLSKENPNNINIIRIYASILSSRGEYSNAIKELGNFNKNNENAELALQECMLKDRIGNYDEPCYTNALRLIDSSAHANLDRLIILYLTNSPKFVQERERYIKSTNDAEGVVIFKMDKRSFLKELYPN